MKNRIYKAVCEAEDSVRIYILCEACVKSIVIIGRGEVSSDRDVYIL